MYVVLLPASSAICPLSCTALLTPHLWLLPSGRFAHIERVNQQRGELVQRRDELHQRLGGAERALAGAQQEQQKMHKVGGRAGGWVAGAWLLGVVWRSLQRHVGGGIGGHHLRQKSVAGVALVGISNMPAAWVPQVLASKERGLGGPAPTSLRAAEKQLAAARRHAEAAAGAEPEEALQARYGNPKHPVTASIDRILQSGACSGGGTYSRVAIRIALANW